MLDSRESDNDMMFNKIDVLYYVMKKSLGGLCLFGIDIFFIESVI